VLDHYWQPLVCLMVHQLALLLHPLKVWRWLHCQHRPALLLLLLPCCCLRGPAVTLVSGCLSS